MTRSGRNQEGKGGLELIEEATQLLRAVPAAAFAGYYLGTAPFVLGALYFWADMSRSPFADQHLAGAALGLALLFLWMKLCQALFAGELRAVLAGGAKPPLSLARLSRLFSTQSALHATGLFLLPLALISVVGFPWIYAYYQNATVLDEGQAAGVGPLAKRCWQQTWFWPRQHPKLLAVLFGFGLMVWLNWASFCFVLPGLVKMLLGVESVFTRSNFSLLNSTFFAVIFGLTYLCVDPLIKAVYTLRCFYGESVNSGQDLKAELSEIRKLLDHGVIAAVLFCLAVLAGPRTALGQDSSAGATPKNVSANELDRAIEQVVRQPKYTWRMPRPKEVAPESNEQGFLDRLLARVGRFFRQVFKGLGDWLSGWLRKLFSRPRPSSPGGSGYGWILLEELLLYGLLAAAVIAVLYLLFRSWWRNRPPGSSVVAEPIATAPDLSDQNLGADQLPEDAWTRLARELWARGELRLALRAFYFASLAHLAERNLIQLARFKSNRDYERELLRRGHAWPELLGLFSENVVVFDRVWYGMQEMSGELVNRFAANVEKLRGVH